ncbi:MAG: hypothetical protein ACW99L_14740, partial [Promethearchaeota archaeon]
MVSYSKNYGKKPEIEGRNEKKIILQQKKSSKDAAKIWTVNPSYKHVNSLVVNSRIVMMTIIFLLFVCTTYLLYSNFFLSLGIGTVILISFIVVFHDQFYIFQNQRPTLFRKSGEIRPFRDIIFFFEQNSPYTLFLSNRKDSVNTGIQIFRIDVIPENVHASTNLFIKALSEYKNMVNFTYQVIQNPLVQETSKKVLMTSRSTSIYFCVYFAEKGILSNSKFKRLKDRLQFFSNSLQNNFVGNFHHFKITHLQGIELIQAIRSWVINIPISSKGGFDTKLNFRLNPWFLLKVFIVFAIIVYGNILLFELGISFLFNLSVTISLLIALVYLWWRKLLSIPLKRKISNNLRFRIMDPFKDTKFFQYHGFSDSLFAYVDNKLLVGMKIFNLTIAFPPLYCRPDKFIQTIMNRKISFSYTCINTPIPYSVFYKEGLKYLTQKAEGNLLKSQWRVRTQIDGIKWLAKRSGMWKTFLTISAHEFDIVDEITYSAIHIIEERLEQKAQALNNAFNEYFFNYELNRLCKKKLVSGVQCEILKHTNFSTSGTHLNYLLFQGKSIVFLTQIVDELKKGITTRIASEFNTPLQLKNFITLGHTINTEVLDKEIPFGFTRDQINNVLVVNGTPYSREMLAMKMVKELIENNIPSLIFDFKGTWSKLINSYKGTRYENEFLYFKLGSAFSLDPLKSDIPYDKDNVDFLNYMFDVYAMAFKRNQGTIDLMRNTILRNPEMDATSLNLHLINQNPWEKSPISDTLLALFGDFTQQDLTYINITSSDHSEVITFQKFIQDNKTVIIDLSVANDYTKQSFLTFLILSKIIHYLASDEEKEYQNKTIVIPHIDIFFEGIFIDRNVDYGKINKFLDPLIENGFGFLFLANQAHYIHHNLYNFFDNIVTFKTKDKRDIAALNSIMNLQELHGTGYYSSTRDNTYQISYLISLKEDEAVVKRSDIYQSFPVQFEWKNLVALKTMSDAEIFEYMEDQGYNLRDIEQNLIKQVKKTLFEKDLGAYSSFTEEIKQFLESMRTVDQIGNLYENKVKKELKLILYPKASKYYKTKTEMKKCRDEIFTILKKHGYLVENHPKTAGGSESVRTSYSVGPKYQKA